MQSGISASQELHDAFKTLVSIPSQRGLLATIKDESLVPITALDSESSDFLSDLSSLSSHLKDNEALYVILRRYDNASDGYIAVTYVPNAAPVRQKMLFASTRLTLVRELGIERFRETIFATEKAELTAEGFKKHDDHNNLAAPLTEEEQTLEAVKKAETTEGRGMANKGLVTHDTLKMSTTPEASEALKNFDGGSYNLVQLKIDIPTETLHLESTATTEASNLTGVISSTEPRYVFFRYTAPSSSESSVLFISTVPSGSKVKERMIYAASRNAIINVIAPEMGIIITKRLEVGDPDEVTEASIAEEFAPKTDTKKAFDRPKRPGRR